MHKNLRSIGNLCVGLAANLGSKSYGLSVDSDVDFARL